MKIAKRSQSDPGGVGSSALPQLPPPEVAAGRHPRTHHATPRVYTGRSRRRGAAAKTSISVQPLQRRPADGGFICSAGSGAGTRLVGIFAVAPKIILSHSARSRTAAPSPTQTGLQTGLGRGSADHVHGCGSPKEAHWCTAPSRVPPSRRHPSRARARFLSSADTGYGRGRGHTPAGR